MQIRDQNGERLKLFSYVFLKLLQPQTQQLVQSLFPKRVQVIVVQLYCKTSGGGVTPPTMWRGGAILPEKLVPIIP